MPVLSTSVLSHNTESSSGTEPDAPAVDGAVDSIQSSRTHKSDDAFGGSSNFHFAMSVEASVAHSQSPQQELKTPITVQSYSVHSISNNPWQKGDPRRRDALPKLCGENDRKRVLQGHFLSSSQSLPRHHVAQSLFERYFSTVNPIWPFLLENVCRKLFNRTYEFQEQSDPVWVAHLNLIFCLSCQSYNAGSDRNSPFGEDPEASYNFYNRAREVVIANTFDLIDVSMVQALLLMALYQQSSLRTRQCYLTVGHATRMAQELGLHIPLPNSSSVSQLNKELRLRLWWGCFSLDR